MRDYQAFFEEMGKRLLPYSPNCIRAYVKHQWDALGAGIRDYGKVDDASIGAWVKTNQGEL